jgi:uncharacterized protein (TIGR02145 family)/uncharacterized repeat protein (TIGR02543 family)
LTSYSVTFNSNGGSPVPAVQTITCNSTATAPTQAPVKTGYTFVGWYLDTSSSTAFNFSTPITGATTLNAKWAIKQFALTITATNGSVTKSPNAAQYDSGTVVSLTPVPAAGYQFTGWSGGLTGTANPVSITMTGVKSVTANFGLNAPTITTHPSNKSVILNGTVTFNVVASGLSLSYQWQKNGVNIASANSASYTIPPATVTDNNSTYQCVVTNGGGSVTSNPATLTLQCTITYNGNGGTGNAPQTGTYNYNSFVTVANGGSLALSGFVLWYWNTKSDGTGPTDYTLSTGQFQITSNVTLYAKWQVRDIDGNLYDTVHIGTQIWMKQNLQTTKYNNNTTIPQVNGGTGWSTLSTPAYCWYGDNINNKDYSGALYNFYAVDTKILAPTGWHVPTDADFSTLNTYLQNNGGCDQFATIMGGYCTGYANGSGMEPFLNTTVSGYWWSNSASTQYGLGFQIDYPSFYLNYSSWVKYGYSVRCIMGSP